MEHKEWCSFPRGSFLLQNFKDAYMKKSENIVHANSTSFAQFSPLGGIYLALYPENFLWEFMGYPSYSPANPTTPPPPPPFFFFFFFFLCIVLGMSHQATGCVFYNPQPICTATYIFGVGGWVGVGAK